MLTPTAVFHVGMSKRRGGSGRSAGRSRSRQSDRRVPASLVSGDEDRRLGDRARLRIDDVDAAARVVDEELLAGAVLLAHDEIELTPPRAVEITEARVPVATLGMGLAVLLPEQLERDSPSLELVVERREVREWSAVAPLRR